MLAVIKMCQVARHYSQLFRARGCTAFVKPDVRFTPCKAVLCAAQVRCFGMGMVNLDCRQESSRHSDVIDRVTTYLGLGSYK